MSKGVEGKNGDKIERVMKMETQRRLRNERQKRKTKE